MGLLLSHKSTLRVFSDLVTVSTPFADPPKGGGKRGDIEGFSAESRKRMIEFMHTLTFTGMTFITLTYPAEYPHDYKVYKSHLKRWHQSFERRYGKVRAVWRLEYQKRGAPHYHIMYLDPPFLPIDELSAVWYKIVGSKDENHLRAGVDLKPVTEWGDSGLVAHYIGKYAAKQSEEVSEDDAGKTGRHWGYWNIEKASPIEIELEPWQAERIALVLFSSRGRADTWRPSQYGNCTIMGDSLGSDRFGKFAHHLTLFGELLGEYRKG